MSTDRQAEREAITAAMQRLLAGAPQRSSGALTVLQLAAEADVKRWVLTHKHPDLKAEFEQRRARANGIPAAFQAVAAQVNDLGQANQRLRAENAELRQRVDAYAQVIYQLSTELHHLQATQPQTNNVRPLRQRPS
jgi:chromosome segregation ATPase